MIPRIHCAAAALLGLCAAVACARSAPDTTTPHLVLITADALRADRLGVYGHARNTSPRIDAFAAEAWVFDQAITLIPKTGPSFATLFSGRTPREHGVRSNANVLPGGTPLLAEELARAGYASIAFVQNPELMPDKGYARGFSRYESIDSKHGPAALTQRFLAWQRSPEAWQRPTFLWLHFIDPHGPLTPEPELLAAFVDDETARAEMRAIPSGPPHAYFNPNKLLGGMPRYQRLRGEQRLSAYLAHYDAEIRAVDREVGRVLDALAEASRLDDSAIVFASDHGESLGEHDYWFEHGWFAYESALRIPLLIRLPGAADHGRRSDLASNLDLLPTLLGLAGVPTPAGTRGRDLLTDSAAERALPIENSDRYPVKYLGLRTANWKYLRREDGSGEELYDVSADPAEHSDLAALEPERRDALRRQLQDLLSSHTLLPGAGAVHVDPRRHMQERLQALGYLDE